MTAPGLDASYVAFLTFTVILVVTPGSTTAVVVRNTLEGSRRAGYVTALGAALANTIIATACGLGLAVMLAYWPGSVDAIRLGGAAFLAWLGLASLWRAWQHSDGGIRLSTETHVAGPTFVPGLSTFAQGPTADESVDTLGMSRHFGDGLAINLLSPVIISFYLSVVPSFMPAASARLYYTGLAATHVSMALVCHSMWATGLDAMRRWFVAPWTRRALQATTGLALVWLAVRIVL